MEWRCRCMKPSIAGHCTEQTGSFTCLFGCSQLARPLRLAPQPVGSPCSVVSLISYTRIPVGFSCFFVYLLDLNIFLILLWGTANCLLLMIHNRPEMGSDVLPSTLTMLIRNWQIQHQFCGSTLERTSIYLACRNQGCICPVTSPILIFPCQYI